MIYWDNNASATTENTTAPRHLAGKPAAPAAPPSIATLGTRSGDTRAETRGMFVVLGTLERWHQIKDQRDTHSSGDLREVTSKQRLERCLRFCRTWRADTESRDQREAPGDLREVKPEQRPEG